MVYDMYVRHEYVRCNLILAMFVRYGRLVGTYKAHIIVDIKNVAQRKLITLSVLHTWCKLSVLTRLNFNTVEVRILYTTLHVNHSKNFPVYIHKTVTVY